jgi:(p)ppGpp synthase/HD superfamily hydrolase
MNRSQFKSKTTEIFLPREVDMIMTAYDCAKSAHRTQERESVPHHATTEEKRYFNHPKRIAIQMIEDGITDAGTICTALLHDSVEDTGIFGNQKVDGYYEAIRNAYTRLGRLFNDQIAQSVISLTLPIVQDKGGIGEFSTKTKCLAFYKKKLADASGRALLVKLYDRLDNLSTIEVKPPQVVMLKLKETEDFYIPLFQKKFSGNNIDPKLKKIGRVKTSELKNLIEEKRNAPPAFKNRYGIIKVGTPVSFQVENQSDWVGDCEGTLVYQEDSFKIKTQNSGVLTIDKGYDVYSGTIQPLVLA